MKYVYPAIFRKDREMPDTWNVTFPDVEGAITCGYSLYEALEMAEDSLATVLCAWEDFKSGNVTVVDGKPIPMNNRIVAPTPIEQVVAEPDEYSASAFVTLIKVDTDAYRETLAKMHAEKSAAEKARAKVAA